ncbi:MULTISPECIES: hypothetical protein [unclassified Bradyrhizobium]|uniref:hypothetical protein n=1 Tax=unclassified Bradyrhizobium TaxID=2631580 RepID=UPI0028ED47CB|nr:MULTISPECIES: hypothetical protein [unclassified Bradyrhizobium]
MTKPTKTEAELIAMAKAELKARVGCRDGMAISVLRWGTKWELCAKADPGTATRPGYPESMSTLVKISDELSKQYDVVG